MRRVASDEGGVVGVEVIVKPVIVPVPGLAIEVQVPDVQVVIGVAIYIECHPCHYLLNTLEIEFDSVS